MNDDYVKIYNDMISNISTFVTANYRFRVGTNDEWKHDVEEDVKAIVNQWFDRYPLLRDALTKYSLLKGNKGSIVFDLSFHEDIFNPDATTPCERIGFFHDVIIVKVTEPIPECIVE